MLTRRQWLQGSAAALAAGLGQGPGWTQGNRSVIAARFGTLPARPGRVFAAGPPASALLAVLAPQQLLGWPMQLSDAARAYLGPQLQALPYLGRLSGRGSTLPLEKLLALQPDLVLDSGTSDATHVSAAERLARQTGLACVLVQGSLPEHAGQLREIGALLGVAERGETLARHADEVAALVHAVTVGLGEQARPRVYLGRGANGLETGLAGSINVEVINYAGGRNVAAQAGTGGLTRVSMEQILAWDPEVILTQEAGFAERVRQDPLWSGVGAVRSGRVHCAPVLPFGWLDGPPGVNRLIGVRWLLEKLHPGRLAQQGAKPLEQAVREFHALFYGAQLSPSQLRALLDAAR